MFIMFSLSRRTLKPAPHECPSQQTLKAATHEDRPSTSLITPFSYRCTRKALADAILIMLLRKFVYFMEYRKPKYPVTAKMKQFGLNTIDIFADGVVYYIID